MGMEVPGKLKCPQCRGRRCEAAVSQGHEHHPMLPAINDVSLLMRPWVLLMRKLSIVPLVLADDVLIVAAGEDNE